MPRERSQDHAPVLHTKVSDTWTPGGHQGGQSWDTGRHQGDTGGTVMRHMVGAEKQGTVMRRGQRDVTEIWLHIHHPCMIFWPDTVFKNPIFNWCFRIDNSLFYHPIIQ